MITYGNFKFKQAGPEDLKKIFRLRYEVYAIEFGFENPADFPDKLEKDAYDAHSVHFVALNAYDEVIGTVRMILDSPKGFPVEHAAKITRFHDKPAPERLTEVSRLAVSKRLRRRPEDGMHGIESYIPQSQGGVSDKKPENPVVEKREKPVIVLGLYKAVYHKCKELGITHMYMITEDKLFYALYKFGFIFSQVGEPVIYHGKRTPYATSWYEIEKHMHVHHKKLFDFLLLDLEKRFHPDFLTS